MSNKRELEEKSEPQAKRPHVESLREKYPEQFEALNVLQEDLEKLDKQCGLAQIVLQRECDLKKGPLREQRQSLIDKIPGFWGTVVTKHPDCAGLLTPEEREMWMLLQKIDVVDNLDEFGSFKITLTFEPKASEFFEPTTLEKTVTFGEDDKTSTDEKDVTVITFKEGHDPLPPQSSEEETSEDQPPSSALYWFRSDAQNDPMEDRIIDIGEVIRRELYERPTALLALFAELDDDSDGEDDDEDDEDDDDEEMNNQPEGEGEEEAA